MHPRPEREVCRRLKANWDTRLCEVRPRAVTPNNLLVSVNGCSPLQESKAPGNFAGNLGGTADRLCRSSLYGDERLFFTAILTEITENKEG